MEEVGINLEKLQPHEHPLVLVDLQPEYPHYEEYDTEEEENDWNKKWDFNHPCNLCSREINLHHRYYYKCTHQSSSSCDYFLHKFCAELPKELKHGSHRKLGHSLALLFSAHGNVDLDPVQPWELCNICYTEHGPKESHYKCTKCVDPFLVCVRSVVAHKVNQIIYHPSHPHPLVSVTSQPVLHECNACGKKHEGVLYRCTTCFEVSISIQSDCLLLPKMLQLLHLHIHPLILSYSFPIPDQEAKFYPRCRICGTGFDLHDNLWIYKCEKCRYYVHLDCAKSSKKSGNKKIVTNFKDFAHPGLLNLPFPDQTYRISQIIRLSTFRTNKEGNLNNCHQHPLCLETNSSSCHNPMKNIQLLCDGCVRPITGVPFFKCTNVQCCNFVLHEGCTRLPAQVQNHPAHPQHTLILYPKVPSEFFGVLISCRVCELPCNGFVYGCEECNYYIDVSCGFIPRKIAHEAHPGHHFRFQSYGIYNCLACFKSFSPDSFSYRCFDCHVSLHIGCALLLSKTVTHKYDKHPMNLSYLPIENHKSEYFCEICEEEFDPKPWFYHCQECVQSVHSACAPLILESERDVYSCYGKGVYEFVNIKFGGILNVEGHSHSLVFAQGIKRDGNCKECNGMLRYYMIFKCLECTFRIHYSCCSKLSNEGLAHAHLLS